MNARLVVAALAAEAAHVGDLPGVEVLVTGVGKAAAAAALGRRLATGPRPEVVVNIGTAGALDASYSGIVEVGWVTQHDFPYAAIEALAGADVTARGYALFDDRPPTAADAAPAGAVAVASGDAFVNDPQRAAAIAASGMHLVDMEAFALAAVCFEFGLPLRCVKAVSDAADADAARSWVETVDRCARALAEWLAADTSR